MIEDLLAGALGAGLMALVWWSVGRRPVIHTMDRPRDGKGRFVPLRRR